MWKWSELMGKYFGKDRMQVAPGLRIREPRLVQIGERLKVARKAAGLKQEQVEVELQIAQTTLSSWEIGKNWPPLLMLEKLAELYGVAPSYLAGLDELGEEQALTARPDLLSVPIVGEVCAGRGARSGEDVRIEDAVRGRVREVLEILARRFQRKLRAANHEVAALVVNGDSMEPEYRNGDQVLVERLEELSDLRDRDCVIATIDGSDGWVLRLWIEGPRQLAPFNMGKFDPVTAGDETRVWGRVIGLVRMVEG